MNTIVDIDQIAIKFSKQQSWHLSVLLMTQCHIIYDINIGMLNGFLWTCSRIPITQTFKGNRKMKIAGRKEKKQCLLRSEHFNHS